MLDFEQQANQAQALASLDEDWHLLEAAFRTGLSTFLFLLLAARTSGIAFTGFIVIS